MHAQRGDSVCKNSLKIQRHELEERLIAGLKERVLREEFVDYVICGLRDELRKRHEALNAELSELREEKRGIEAKLKNLVDSIETKTASPTVMARIAGHEARIQEITNKLLEPGPESLQEKLEGLRALAVEHLTQLRGLLTNPGTIHEARALLAEQVGKFTLEREETDGAVTFKANGKIDFFGEKALTQLSGAGGPAGTMQSADSV